MALLQWLLAIFVVVSRCSEAGDCLSADGASASARTCLECTACLSEQQDEEEVQLQEEADAEAMSVGLLQVQVNRGRRTVFPAAIHHQDILHPLRAVANHATQAQALTTQLPSSHLQAAADKHSKATGLMKAGIPVAAFILGGIFLLTGYRTVGMLVVYFGAQAGFSLYMKLVLSNAYVSEEFNLKGIPAAFLVTSIQQVVAFGVICLVIGVSWMTPWRYQPKRLTTVREWGGIFVFSLAFGLNIGLNNFSLSLVAVSLNLIVRSCVPLVTLVLQLLTGLTGGRVRIAEVALMVFGVAFAGLATIAKEEGSKDSGSEESKHFLLGVFMCSLSDVAAALNLVLAAWFGTYVHLNAVDTTLYMAVPAGLTLLPAVFYCQHPVDWPGYGSITDWTILRKVYDIRPDVMGLVILSGVFAAGYNLLQYTLVQRLSAAHAAFAGNFNKAATIMISICLGFESLPGGFWSAMMLLAIVGNILSFTGYSVLKVSDKEQAAAKEAGGDGVLPSSIAPPQSKAGT
mmetsp:Transcript_14166/g.29736  ORF Transcript_14166/g.29736 Transcript_14166/m.29736 type:complete len:515 (+) Transcript_14166:89-1633(+)